MKHTTFIFAVLFASIFFSCEQTNVKSFDDKQLIDLSKVEYIEIRNQSGINDTIQKTPKRLTKEQSKLFVESWNKADPNGPCKYIAVYWVNVKLKDNTTRTFRINGNNAKENNDFCYDIGDSKFTEQMLK